jgi:hypothetical protein
MVKESRAAPENESGFQGAEPVFSFGSSDSSDTTVPAGGKKESNAACHVRLDLSA